MKIDFSNRNAVQNELDAVQKGCRMRMLTDEDVYTEVLVQESRLKSFASEGVRKGCKLTITNGFGKKPNAYNGSPMASFVLLERGVKKWFVTSVTRDFANTSMEAEGVSSRLTLTEAAKQSIIENEENWR